MQGSVDVVLVPGRRQKAVQRQLTSQMCGSVVEHLPSMQKNPVLESLAVKKKKKK